ncbi:MAG: hydrogen peroxide-inducible genes activator [Pseudomonadota bacterium]
MRITLRQLHYFDALSRERHFGRAAQQVGVTQPAMSTQIRDLEAMLGGPLVDRSGAQIVLTPLGRAVAARAAAVLDGVHGIEALGTAEAPPLRLGMIPTIAPYLVPGFLARMPDGQPVEVSEALTVQLLAALRAGDLDGAVVALPSGGAGLVDRPLFSDRFLLAIPEGPAADLSPLPARPEEIDPERLLLLEDGHCLADQALSACQLRRDVVGRKLGAASLTTLSRMVASGQGVTLIPEIAARIEGTGLDLRRFAEPEPMRTIGLVTRAGLSDADWIETVTSALLRGRDGSAANPHASAAP